MRPSRLSIRLTSALAILSIVLFAPCSWAASHQVLHSFQPVGLDGAYPNAGLIADSAGNLYGAAAWGGAYNVGAIFELSPDDNGGWTEKVLYSFQNNGKDGIAPEAALVFDSAGNLYGTTSDGGIHCLSGCGTVFELSPNQDGSWSETVLHSFGKGADGAGPEGSLIVDAAGNLYGTTVSGGIHTCNSFPNNCGTVFELSPNGSGIWTEKVLHSFGKGTDGTFPNAGLIMDSIGNLYGTTTSGGIHLSWGTVFELSPRQGGGYTETVLHSFGNGVDGADPEGGLIFDSSDNLFGTTEEGGIHGGGTVFKLSPRQGAYSETVLHSFGRDTDGYRPESSLILDSAGNFYSTTGWGGLHGWGTVFELSPRQGGGYTEKVLHSFGKGADGARPYAPLLLDRSGDLLGITEDGGMNGVGAMIQMEPSQDGSWTESVAHSFTVGASDGSIPASGNLVSDPSGNLFGAASSGGEYDSGVVFELAPNGSGGWTETILYSFKNNGRDGNSPEAGLVFDAAGNLYGITHLGGIHGSGAAFELSPDGSGSWTEKVLHSFGGGSDGFQPSSGLMFDGLGNLYGTTVNGGIHGYGTVFEISPNGSGGWTEKVLHGFNGVDGSEPYSSLILDSSGNLYGTTTAGGIRGGGTVFELSPQQNGRWRERVLHNFADNGRDGYYPLSGVIFDAAGNLYGTTVMGGDYCGLEGCGTVFQLSPNPDGGWPETLLHSFSPASGDGSEPLSGLIFDASGNLYGSTYSGGVNNAGTVFQLTPGQGGHYTETVLHSFSPADGDGGDPASGLIFDASGNLYGTTYAGGGMYNAGTVFQITP